MPFLQIKIFLFQLKLVNKVFNFFGAVSNLESNSGGVKSVHKLSCLVRSEILKKLLNSQDCQGNWQKLYSP